MGFYFAEKDTPFPIGYSKRPDGRTGTLEVDLQIVDIISRDFKNAVGYGSAETPSPSHGQPSVL